MKRLLLLLLPLAACEEVVPEGPAPVVCQAPAYAPYVGRAESALAGVLIQAPYRIIRPGDAVTEDFSATRLNIRIGTDGRIAAVDCG